MSNASLPLGIRENFGQFTHKLIQVLLVGFALGMTRTVIPALAETEFGVVRGSFVMLTVFVMAFGVVKAVMNFVAGLIREEQRAQHGGGAHDRGGARLEHAATRTTCNAAGEQCVRARAGVRARRAGKWAWEGERRGLRRWEVYNMDDSNDTLGILVSLLFAPAARHRAARCTANCSVLPRACDAARTCTAHRAGSHHGARC